MKLGTGLRTAPLLQFQAPETRDIANVPATWGQGFDAAAADAFMGSPGPLAFRWFRRNMPSSLIDALPLPEDQKPPSDIISAEEANAKFGIGDLKFDAPVEREYATELYELQKDRLRRMDIVRRSQLGGFDTFVAGLAGASLDPLSVAAALFPPALLARGGAAATAAARIGRAAAEGALGSAAVVPVTYLLSSREGRPYDLADAFIDVTFGTALSGGVTAGLEFFARWKRTGQPMPPVQQAIANLPREQQIALLRGAVANVMEGRPVNVEPAVAHAVLDLAERDFGRLARSQERLDAEESAALTVADKADQAKLQLNKTNERIAELEAEQGALARDIGEGDARLARERELAGDPVTAARLEAIDAELASATITAPRKAALAAEKRMLEDGPAQSNEELALNAMRTEAEVGALRQQLGRTTRELDRARGSAAKTNDLVAKTEADFRRASGRAASRRAIIQALGEKTLERALRRVGRTAPPEAIAAATRELLKLGRGAGRAMDNALATLAAKSADVSLPRAGAVASLPRASRSAVIADIAKQNVQKYVDPSDKAASNAAAEMVSAGKVAIRARNPDEGIGEATPELREMEELQKLADADIAEAKRLGVLTEADEAALAEADEAISRAKATAQMRDMAAICLTGVVA